MNMKLLITTQAVDLDDPVLGFFHAWIEAFARHVESIEVLCLRKGRYSLPANVTITSLGKDEGKGRITRATRFLRAIVGKRHAYDAVFVHMNPEYLVIGGLLWRLMGKKTALWYVHRSVNLKLRIATLFANIIFTSSSESFRLQTSKLRIMGHGIDERFFASQKMRKDGNSFAIGTSGRLSPSKRPERILEVCRALHAQGEQVTLSFAGPRPNEKDPRESALHNAAAGAGFPATFTGPVEHTKMPEFLAGLDVFINLSETQSLDKAVLEAIAMGLPVVTTNQAFLELLPQGAVLPPQADIEKLSDAMRAQRGSDMEVYRKQVEERHSLKALIPRIIATLSD